MAFAALALAVFGAIECIPNNRLFKSTVLNEYPSQFSAR